MLIAYLDKCSYYIYLHIFIFLSSFQKSGIFFMKVQVLRMTNGNHG